MKVLTFVWKAAMTTLSNTNTTSIFGMVGKPIKVNSKLKEKD